MPRKRELHRAFVQYVCCYFYSLHLANFCNSHLFLSSSFLDEMDHLKIHCFRALLEYVIDKKYPKYRHPELAKVRNYHLISFPEYAIKVTRNLDICFDPQDLDNEQTRQRLAKYMDVVIFYTLRLHLAPMLETFINLDRMIYLYEDSCISSALVPVFDATISPRNCILISKK